MRQRLELETGLERTDLRDVTVEHGAHVAHVVPALLEQIREPIGHEGQQRCAVLAPERRGGTIEQWTDSQPRRKRQFSFHAAQGEINIPLMRRLSLQLAGGGSTTWWFGTIGARTYLRGSGGPGTIVLTGGVGATGITEENYDRGIGAYGPLLTLGIDYRF